MLKVEDIKSFQELYRKTFGKEIDDENAYIQASNLIQMMRAIHKPMTKSELNKLNKRREETNEKR